MVALATFFFQQVIPKPEQPEHVVERIDVDQPSRLHSAAHTGLASPDQAEYATDNGGPRTDRLTPIALAHQSPRKAVAETMARKQPVTADDWDTETLTEHINQRLNIFTQWITEEQPDTQDLAKVLAEDFECTALRPGGLTVAFQDQRLLVRRWQPPDQHFANLTHPGQEYLQHEFQRLLAALGPRGDRYAKFKLFAIRDATEVIRTRLYFEASNRSPNHCAQQVATWSCHWQRSDGTSSNLRLSRISLESYEEAISETDALFDENTAAVLSSNAAYSEQVLPSLSYWLKRIGREFMTQFGHHGIAVGDVNGDGLDDLYVCDAGGLPNRLYVQQPDGSARDMSAMAGVDILEDSVGALLIDLDNDGDQDLVVATDPLVHCAENDGNGKFRIHRGYYANTDSYSLAAADYDQDGDLDIYVCGYNARKQDPVNRGLPFPLPYHDANNGGRNYLLRNEGQFRFVDVTAETGLDVHNSRFSLAAAWEDFDDDGDQDLYVANDFGRNCLYRNDGGHFTDIAAAAGVEDHASGMSVAWGDPNRDGRMDVYVSNMFSAAGNRVTYQRRFATGLEHRELSLLQRMARGNTLFSQTAKGVFADISEPAGVTLGRWAWGSRFADLNNDGWEDLLVANGYVTSDYQDDL